MELGDLDVLIVDDHETMRVLLARVFTKAGVNNVRDAASGAEALVALSERPATLILADQNMPGMDGTAFVSAVRADPKLSAARVMIISGKSSREHEAAARAAGADMVLVKPVAPSELLTAINALFAV